MGVAMLSNTHFFFLVWKFTIRTKTKWVDWNCFYQKEKGQKRHIAQLSKHAKRQTLEYDYQKVECLNHFPRKMWERF